MTIIFLFFIVIVNASELQQFLDSNVQFASDVYRVVSHKNQDNFLICPLSAQIILSLATVGAKENTAKQLSTCLHLPDDSTKIQSIFKQINNNFDKKEPYQFSCANKIFLNDKCHIKNEYQEIAGHIFKAGVENINFGDSENAAKIVNEWVESKTDNKIKNLVAKDSLNTDMLAVLVNALYFRGDWVYKFGNNLGYQENFYISKNETVPIDSMIQRNDFKYYYNKKLKAEFLELPFVGEDVVMTFVLPNEKDGLTELEKQISSVLSNQPLEMVDAMITIPKFKMESSIDFKDTLESLGVTEPFVKGANFNGISEFPMHIDKIVQKTFIEVNEIGTTAAAATEILLILDSLPSVDFTINRPFIYFLKHRSNGVFFVGRFCKP